MLSADGPLPTRPPPFYPTRSPSRFLHEGYGHSELWEWAAHVQNITEMPDESCFLFVYLVHEHTTGKYGGDPAPDLINRAPWHVLSPCIEKELLRLEVRSDRICAWYWGDEAEYVSDKMHLPLSETSPSVAFGSGIFSYRK